MRNVPLTLMLGLTLASAERPAIAHQSFAAEHGASKQITMTSTVTKFDWTNPNARFYLDVGNANSPVTNWKFELGPVNILARIGWKKNSVNDDLSVVGNPAKDASQTASAWTVASIDGRRVFAGSSADNKGQT